MSQLKHTSSKKTKLSTQSQNNENIDSNACCTCFENYKDDVPDGAPVQFGYHVLADDGKTRNVWKSANKRTKEKIVNFPFV